MKELNLTVGQKLWSIQLGECKVNHANEYAIQCINSANKKCTYSINGKYRVSDAFSSIFLSNPFEPKLVQESKDGWIEPKGNKAEMIKALRLIYKDCFDTDIKIIAKDKLQKLLESL